MRLPALCAGGAVLTGLLLAALFPPLGWSALAPVALAPLLYAMAHEPRLSPRFLYGWLSGAVFWIAVCYWIREVLGNYGGLNAGLSWAALALFAAAKGLHTAVFAALAGPVMRRWWAVPAVAALWTGIERTHGPLGFAWLVLGNAGAGMAAPLRLAPWTGVYGLSFVFAMIGAAAAALALRRKRGELVWLLPLLGLWLLPAMEPGSRYDREAVAVQINVPGDARWGEAELRAMTRRLAVRTLEMALDPGRRPPALLLWPEAPAPFYYYDDAQFRREVTETARLARAPFLFGTVAWTAERAPLNSAVLLDGSGHLAGRYDKARLVPFGEFIPPGFHWIRKISSEAGDYAAGGGARVLMADGLAIGVFICYESAFPDYVRQFAAGGAEVLVNLTNDGYFGRSAARAQHLLLARMRAVENGRWLLRASNDGITASIDPAGRVWGAFPEHEFHAARLPFRHLSGRTFYTRHGDWFAWLALVAGLAGFAATQIPVYRPLE
ncbi:MAG: apolipoprotein N-acyltransferase [Bryobacteraceae bacterium]